MQIADHNNPPNGGDLKIKKKTNKNRASLRLWANPVLAGGPGLAVHPDPSLPGSGFFHQPLIWALWEQMLGLAGLEAVGSSLAALVLVPRCRQQPRALSQWFPWQPSHPASSLQCQEIKQDDTTAPQKEEEKKNKNNTPGEHQQPVSSFPQPMLLASSPSVSYAFVQGEAETLRMFSVCSGRCWRAGKWLLCKLGSGAWSNFGQVPPCLFPGHLSGLAVCVGNTTGKGV